MPTPPPLPRTLDEVSPEWVSQVVSRRAASARCTSVAVADVMPGSAVKARLKLTFDGGDDLPETMILKGGLGGPMVEMARGAYLNEARFFVDIADDLPVRRPRCFGAAVDEEAGDGLVLLEDLAATGATFGRAATPVTVDEAAATVELLARLHAHWWEHDALRRHEWLQGGGLRQVMGVLLSAPHWDHYLALRDDVVPDEVRDREAVAGAVDRMWEWDERLPRCLVHGDAHLDNLYFSAAREPGLLDWQTVQRGPWVHDVAYFLIGALETEDRRAHERDLLHHYLGALGSTGVDAPSPDEAFLSYRRHVWHGFLWWLTPIEMQPDETSRTVGRRFTAAAVDLDAFAAVS